jgi:hypothetical protein
MTTYLVVLTLYVILCMYRLYIFRRPNGLPSESHQEA